MYRKEPWIYKYYKKVKLDTGKTYHYEDPEN